MSLHSAGAGTLVHQVLVVRVAPGALTVLIFRMVPIGGAGGGEVAEIKKRDSHT